MAEKRFNPSSIALRRPHHPPELPGRTICTTSSGAVFGRSFSCRSGPTCSQLGFCSFCSQTGATCGSSGTAATGSSTASEPFPSSTSALKRPTVSRGRLKTSSAREKRQEALRAQRICLCALSASCVSLSADRILYPVPIATYLMTGSVSASFCSTGSSFSSSGMRERSTKGRRRSCGCGA